MDNRDDKSKQWSQLLAKIHNIKFAMLTTEDEDGYLHSRPMATLEEDSEGALWFFTGKSSHKSHEIDRNPRVNLSYIAGDKDTYLSVAGEGHLVEDATRAKKFWNPLMKAWFPKGLEDPELALLRVDVDEAEYWDVASKKMTTLFHFGKSLLGAANPMASNGHGTIRPDRDL
ncbi:MAG: pyridoxamine 5'-phosphate oxidase family protein [Fibrobacteria bacterium]